MTKDGAGGGEGAEAFSLIPRETLLALYDGLVRARESRRAGNSARVWKYVAAAVAVAQDLRPGDLVIAEWPVPAVGTVLVPSGARGFAAELERAAGVALAHKSKMLGKVVVVFGRGAGEAWSDALETARAHRLPVVFVAEMRESDGAESRRNLEPGTELPRIVVDGNDAVASYRVAHEAIQRARRNRGATLMECMAYRLIGRKAQDSVGMMKAYLRAKGIVRE